MVMTVEGDSMEPIVGDGDKVLFAENAEITTGGSITQPPQLPITDREITLTYHSNPPPAAPPTAPPDQQPAPRTDCT